MTDDDQDGSDAGWVEDNGFYGSSDSGFEWATPRWLVEPLADALGGFDFDAASGAEDSPIARQALTEDDDALSTPWPPGRGWLNPPYGRSENPTWADRVTTQVERDEVDSVTVLIPASTGSDWFANHYAHADALTLIHQRITFGDATNNATFDSILAHFGDFPDEYWDAIRRWRNDDGPVASTTYTHRHG